MSVSTYYPFCSSKITVRNGKYITLSELNAITNLTKKVLRVYFTNDKIVNQIPGHLEHNEYVSLKDIKEYLESLGWKGLVEDAMKQLETPEPSKKRERTPPLDDDRQKADVEKVRAEALKLIRKQPASVPFKVNFVLGNEKEKRTKQRESVQWSDVESVALPSSPVARAVAVAPKPADPTLPPQAQAIIDICREHNLAKAVLIYLASAEYKTRIANGTHQCKENAILALREEVRKANYQAWYDELYAKEYEAARKEALAKRAASTNAEIQRMVAKFNLNS